MNYIDDLINRYPTLISCRDDVNKAFEAIKKIYEENGKLLVCGNGGSASDSEHIIGELMKEFKIKRPISKEKKPRFINAIGKDGEFLYNNLQESLPAITLTSNIALSTAYANDARGDLVFAQQVYGYGDEKSALLGISTSGMASNVVYAVKTAKFHGMKTIGMTGCDGGRLKDLCDICICVPEKETYKVQELHLPIYHTICLMLENHFYG